MTDPAVELGFRRSERQPNRDRTELGVVRRRRDEDPSGAAANVGSLEHAVEATVQSSVGKRRAGPLLHRKAFAGENGFVHEEVGRLEHDTVGRNEAARAQDNNVSRNDLPRVDACWRAVPKDRGAYPDAGHEIGRCGLSAELARIADPDARGDDHEDDDGIDPLAGENGRDRSEQQEEEERALDLTPQHAQTRRDTPVRDFVGAELRETTPRVHRR